MPALAATNGTDRVRQRHSIKYLSISASSTSSPTTVEYSDRAGARAVFSSTRAELSAGGEALTVSKIGRGCQSQQILLEGSFVSRAAHEEGIEELRASGLGTIKADFGGGRGVDV